MKVPIIYKSLPKIIIWPVSIFFIIMAGVYYFHYQNLHPSTDDAYVKANMVTIATQVNGRIENVNVVNNQFVKKGQLLFSLDPKPYQYALDNANAALKLSYQKRAVAEAQVDMARAQLKQAQINYDVGQSNIPRLLTLAKEQKVAVSEGVAAEGKLEILKTALQAAQSRLQVALQTLGDSSEHNANIQMAIATLRQAQLNLQHTQIFAPEDGYITNFSLQPGDIIAAGKPLCALVETKTWWVEANFKETQLNHLKKGQPATIKLDLYPNYIFKGDVQSISAGTGSEFSLLPPENATGNWVKVTQRFPVKIAINNSNPNYPLRIGASATVTIDTSH